MFGALGGLLAAAIMKKRFLLFGIAGLVVGGYIGSNLQQSKLVAKDVTAQFVNLNKKNSSKTK